MYRCSSLTFQLLKTPYSTFPCVQLTLFLRLYFCIIICKASTPWITNIVLLTYRENAYFNVLICATNLFFRSILHLSEQLTISSKHPVFIEFEWRKSLNLVIFSSVLPNLMKLFDSHPLNIAQVYMQGVWEECKEGESITIFVV